MVIPEYLIRAGLNTFDGKTAVLQNLRQSTADAPYPSQTNTEDSLQPVLNFAVIPATTGNIVSAITAKQDASSKDVALATYPIAINGVLFNQQYTNTHSAATILTTSATLRTFVTAVDLAITKDVTCDNTTAYVSLVPLTGSSVSYVNMIATQTTTVAALQRTTPFNTPLELKPSSIISLTNIFSVGTMGITVTIYGYTQAV
jgi:hypothetical protein